MDADIFKDILVPVIGGLGIFMLGLQLMSDGIQTLAVNRMRDLLARVAGTPLKGVMAGTFITGVIQSSTAMTVMVVGLVGSGILGLRPAISVIMGANIGTTLGNGLIALPLGPLGLLFGGAFALVHVFSKNERVRNISLTCMGFALIFYGLNLMTGGLRHLRSMPEIMAIISGLNADSVAGVIWCVLAAAVLTALIHSSSATIGIVMGLGASGVLGWKTAVAFSLGADLGTTITSWMASLNLSKNAKRAAYAHIMFNIAGVLVTLPLFFVSLGLLTRVMGVFGAGDPGVSVVRDGVETFPLVPVAVGMYSIGFNVFNTALLLPFVGTFERVLSRIGRSDADDVEDFSVPRFLDRSDSDVSTRLPSVQQEMERHLRAGMLFLAIARRTRQAPATAKAHHAALDILSREIRRYTAAMLRPGTRDTELVASLIEEQDFTACLGETLFQVARRVDREPFSARGLEFVDAVLEEIARAMRTIIPEDGQVSSPVDVKARRQFLQSTRERCLQPGDDWPWAERGRVLELLGSAERAFLLIDRIEIERASVPRVVSAQSETAAAPQPSGHLAPAVP